jgi:S-adenosylmethionine uptake transporter
LRGDHDLAPTLDQNQLFAGLGRPAVSMGGSSVPPQVTALGSWAGRRTVFTLRCTALVDLASTLIDSLQIVGVIGRPPGLVPIGVLASLGQWCMTRASRGPTMLVANLQYSGIVFCRHLWLIFFWRPDCALVGWAGIALIVGSGLLATVLRSRMAATAPTPRPC